MATLKVANISSGIVSIAVGGFFYFLTFSFPDIELDVLGAEFLPRLYSILLILFGLILLVQAVVKKDSEEKDDEQKPSTYIYGLSTIAIVLLYILILPYVGFYISTILAMLALLYFSKVRKVLVLVSVPLGVILFIYVVFEILLKVPVPTGSFFL